MSAALDGQSSLAQGAPEAAGLRGGLQGGFWENEGARIWDADPGHRVRRDDKVGRPVAAPSVAQLLILLPRMVATLWPPEFIFLPHLLWSCEPSTWRSGAWSPGAQGKGSGVGLMPSPRERGSGDSSGSPWLTSATGPRAG